MRSFLDVNNDNDNNKSDSLLQSADSKEGRDTKTHMCINTSYDCNEEVNMQLEQLESAERSSRMIQREKVKKERLKLNVLNLRWL